VGSEVDSDDEGRTKIESESEFLLQNIFNRT